MRSASWQRQSGRHLIALFDEGIHAGCPDARLVERFVEDRSEHAFAVLVDRHGPRVMRVCQSVARDRHAAEDAFQATFMTLARKAGSLRIRDSLGPWLHGVAVRVASTARTIERRRKLRETRFAGMRGIATEDRRDDPSLERLLHLEIARLPGSLREAVILCDVEGLARSEAAERLGIPLGTLKSRHSRGRERLRQGLTKRGLTPAVVLTAGRGTAAVPEVLRIATTRGAILAASTHPITGALATISCFLSKGIAMTRAQMLVGLLTAGFCGMGVDSSVRPDGKGAAEAHAFEPPRPGEETTKPETRSEMLYRLLSEIKSESEAKATPPAPGTAPPVEEKKPIEVDKAWSVAAALKMLKSQQEGDGIAETISTTDKLAWITLCEQLSRNGQAILEKLGESVDPAKVYPVVGSAELVHLHYKATLYFTLHSGSKEKRVEVVYFDRDFLRRVADLSKPEDRVLAETNEAFVVQERLNSLTSALQERLEKPTPPDEESRLSAVERKLDLILNALEKTGEKPDRPVLR